MVSSCTLLGNIYSAMNNPDEAYSYYQKALESLDDNTTNETRAELYFKYALAMMTGRMKKCIRILCKMHNYRRKKSIQSSCIFQHGLLLL